MASADPSTTQGVIVRFDKAMIVSKAAYGGASGCGIDFLKSEAVAEEVAARLWGNLRAAKISLARENIEVRRSIEHPGTWLVRYRRVRLASLAPGAREINARQGEAIKQAVEASYLPENLVDSWMA